MLAPVATYWRLELYIKVLPDPKAYSWLLEQLCCSQKNINFGLKWLQDYQAALEPGGGRGCFCVGGGGHAGNICVVGGVCGGTYSGGMVKSGHCTFGSAIDA